MSSEDARSGGVAFLTIAILFVSLFVGCLDSDEDPAENLPPIIDDNGTIPDSYIKGELDAIEVELFDENLQTLQVTVSVDDNPVDTEFLLRYDQAGNENKLVLVSISDLDVGAHKIKISAEDEVGQMTTWLTLISIVETPSDEQAQTGSEQGNETGSEQGNETGSEQGNETGSDQGNATSDNHTSNTVDEWWSSVLLCDEGSPPMVDDYNTTESDNLQCGVSFEIDSGNITISTNGLPNHDFHSGPGCCATSQTKSYNIPLEPLDDPDCNPTISTQNCVMAPERGAVAVAVNGVAIYGPEDGPGGDAVAGQEGAYEEDRQQVWLGMCHGHSGPGGEYHYHADGNCMHWHKETSQTWADYTINSSRSVTEHSPIVGFAFDGYPIYGFVGWDENGSVKEMKSSYRLKEGANGYNGIDDYEYVQGMGDLDSCNGKFGETPEFPNGTYHYHTTWENGEGGIGFPYFINCYRGQLPSSGEGEDDPCAGHGETWGPGIGPPPEECDPGPPPGQMDSSEGLLFVPEITKGPQKGAVWAIIIMTTLFVATNYPTRVSKLPRSPQLRNGQVSVNP